MDLRTIGRSFPLGALVVCLLCAVGSASAADVIEGRVLGGGLPIANSTVTLWAASSDAPKQLAQAKTNESGSFEIGASETQNNAVLYLVATGGEPKAEGNGENPAIALMTVLGTKPAHHVVINEMTTLASVITHSQFIDGTAIKGSALALRIAAGNVPNFVDLGSGSYGATILDGLNSAQTTTMANFATLSSILAACVTRLRPDACSSLFYAATSPAGAYPKDTLAAVESIVRNPSYQADKVFGLLNYFYPLPPPNTPGKLFRPTPFLPYLTFAPSAWIFPLKFTGGGYSGGGKLMIDSEGNAWVADNFTVGAENQDASWTGGVTKFAPNGNPLSPSPLGFRGGGIAGPGFGLTLDAQDNAWVTSFTGQNITKFDKDGKALSPPEGWNFNRQVSQMQGIIATPSGDIWALDLIKGQVVKLPQGDPSKVQFFCQNKTGDPLKNP
jgi:hypothetical protein